MLKEQFVPGVYLMVSEAEIFFRHTSASERLQTADIFVLKTYRDWGKALRKVRNLLEKEVDERTEQFRSSRQCVSFTDTEHQISAKHLEKLAALARDLKES